MEILISKFLDKKPGFSDLSFMEQVKYMAYFFVKVKKDTIFTPKNIDLFFKLASLPKPKNISDMFNKLVKKDVFVPSQNGFVFHREEFRKLEEEFSESKIVVKTNELEEISSVLGKDFDKEIAELKIAFLQQPNCTAFLMRKILEKALFNVICKSTAKTNIQTYKSQRGGLPQLSDMLSWAQNAQIGNKHIISPSTLKNIAGAKFLGDVSAHNYLISVSFEDLKLEITPWRIAIKELAVNL